MVPVREDADSSRPLSPYAASKKAAETLLHSYHHLHGIDAVALRYFTVYGPAGRPDMSVFRFIQAPLQRVSRLRSTATERNSGTSPTWTTCCPRHGGGVVPSGVQNNQPGLRQSGRAERRHQPDRGVGRQDRHFRIPGTPSRRPVDDLGRHLPGQRCAWLDADGRHRRGDSPHGRVVPWLTGNGPGCFPERLVCTHCDFQSFVLNSANAGAMMSFRTKAGNRRTPEVVGNFRRRPAMSGQATAPDTSTATASQK